MKRTIKQSARERRSRRERRTGDPRGARSVSRHGANDENKLTALVYVGASLSPL